MVLAVGRLKAGPERELVTRYDARTQAMARGLGLSGPDVREIDESRARRPQDRAVEEGAALLALVPKDAMLVVLDERGHALTSPAFAAAIGAARDAGTPALVCVVGGPDGLSPRLRAAARLVLSFGAMTWPHQLIRVALAEQLYRAATILAGHPYHRV